MTDEIKKESEINVAKEDTAIAPAVESVLQDTVEWVASTKTPAGNGQEYEEVGKSDIPEPAQARLLEPEIKYAYFAKETQIAVFDQTRRNPRQRMRIRRRPRANLPPRAKAQSRPRVKVQSLRKANRNPEAANRRKARARSHPRVKVQSLRKANLQPKAALQ